MSRSCKYSPRLILVSCLLLIAASQTNTYSQTPAFLKFKVKVVDSVTGKPKSKYFLGETVSVVFTITNQSRRPRIVANLQDTYIPYTLVSEFENKKTKTVEDGRGGTGGSYVGGDGTVYWTESAPRKLTLGPGQSVSVRIDDLRGMYSNKLEDGYHTLTASYGRLQSRVSFRIVIDEAKTIPLLEKLATAPPAKNGDETDKLWAEDQLREIRLPSISGMVTDTAGQPLDHVDIKVSEENLADETRANGRYDFRELKPGRTYTLTPFLQTAGDFSAEWTFQPASRTITNLNSKLTEMNFVATRVRPMVNVASKREGATARASSTHSSPDGKFEVEGVIDEVNAGPWELCCNAAWVDDTPNIYPDWVEINFKEPSGIDWINVFTLQDHPEDSHDPTLDETFTRDGITDFDVQYWTGRGWQLVPGGAIRGNRNVWRKIAFPTLTTNKIRVVVRKALTPYSKIKEVEAIHVNQFPVVKLTGSSNVTTGSSFQFQADISDHDGWLSKYSLDFGDGSPSDQKEFDFKSPTRELNLTPAHTYAAAGTYVVTLRAIDNKFEGSETSMTITVTDPKPATLPRKLSATRQ